MERNICLGSNIRYLRTKEKLTLEELGALIGKSKETINGYEKGRSYPSFEGLLVLSDYFKIKIDDFIFRDLSISRVEEPQAPYHNDFSRLMMARIKELEREIKEHAPELAMRLGL